MQSSSSQLLSFPFLPLIIGITSPRRLPPSPRRLPPSPRKLPLSPRRSPPSPSFFEPKCIFPKCNYPKCIFAKCTRLACLLSFASLLVPERTLFCCSAEFKHFCFCFQNGCWQNIFFQNEKQSRNHNQTI